MSKEIQNKHTNECQTLANYVDAAQLIGNQGPVSALAALTPSSEPLAEGVLGIQANGSMQTGFYAQGGQSGFRSEFQNSTPDEPNINWNGDQSHHFAAYFQSGAAHPNLSMLSPVPSLFESKQSPFSPNQGDVNLGYAAQDLGQLYGMGALGAKDIGAAIRSQICR